MKRSQLITLFLVALLATMVVSLAFAGDDAPAKAKDEAAKIAKMSGKELYKTRCKVCHLADSDNGEYTPMSLIQEQWEDFFDGEFVKTHKTVACPQDTTRMVPDMFNKDMLKKIKKFCVDHAADSEQPMTCG